jgi:hypothetical protein
VQVPSQAESELVVQAIHAKVEHLLGGPVSRYSVIDYLIKRSKGPKPLFEHTRYGHYRLLPEGRTQQDLGRPPQVEAGGLKAGEPAPAIPLAVLVASLKNWVA